MLRYFLFCLNIFQAFHYKLISEDNLSLVSKQVNFVHRPGKINFYFKLTLLSNLY